MPIEFFFRAIREKIFSGSLKNLLALTTETEGENYVKGYSLVEGCLWPLVTRAIDTTLSFVTSTVNLAAFRANYRVCESFVREFKGIVSVTSRDELLSMFNLATYTEFVAIEIADH